MLQYLLIVTCYTVLVYVIALLLLFWFFGFRTFNLYCLFEMYLSVAHSTDQLVVCKVVKTHDHDISIEIFQQYPERGRLDFD